MRNSNVAEIFAELFVGKHSRRNCWWIMSRCLLDSFTVPLHSANDRHSPAVRTVQRDCHWGLTKRWEFPPVTWDHIAMGTRQSQSIFRPPITKGWCQPIWGHVCYPTDNPTATRLGLCSSLCVYRWRDVVSTAVGLFVLEHTQYQYA